MLTRVDWTGTESVPGIVHTTDCDLSDEPTYRGFAPHNRWVEKAETDGQPVAPPMRAAWRGFGTVENERMKPGT
jgi:hypothetical protein